MKVPSLSVVVLSAAVLLTPSAHAQQSVQQLLTEAQQSYMRGDLETAKRQFEMVNKIDPRNPTAIGFLRRLQVEIKKDQGPSLEKQLAAIIIPKIEFKQATLGSALNYLKQAASNATDGKTAVSFVIQLPDEQVNTQAVSLSMTNVPFTEALRYVGSLANVQFDYERYAVVVKAKGGASTASAQTVTKAPAAQ